MNLLKVENNNQKEITNSNNENQKKISLDNFITEAISETYENNINDNNDIQNVNMSSPSSNNKTVTNTYKKKPKLNL